MAPTDNATEAFGHFTSHDGNYNIDLLVYDADAGLLRQYNSYSGSQDLAVTNFRLIDGVMHFDIDQYGHVEYPCYDRVPEPVAKAIVERFDSLQNAMRENPQKVAKWLATHGVTFRPLIPPRR